MENKKNKCLYSEDTAFHGEKTLQGIHGLIKRSRMSDQSRVRIKKKGNVDRTAIIHHSRRG